jgi:hypothetical protein
MSGDSEIDSIHKFAWPQIARELNARGWSVLPRLLSSRACQQMTDLYSAGNLFRSHIKMARHGFGRGEYKYFSYPLPGTIQALRTALLSPTSHDR